MVVSSLLLAADEALMGQRAWFYGGFIAVVTVLLLLDLLVFNRKAHAATFKESVAWSCFWVGMGVTFTAAVYFIYSHHWLGFGLDVRQLDGSYRDVGGWEAAKLYLTAFVVEQSLSADNLFVIAMIFGYFAIPAQYQHRVLFWGIATAVVLRGVMIAAGAALIHQFDWIIYVFGGFLILTAIKMAFSSDHGPDPEHNPAVKLVRKVFPVSPAYDGQKFLTRDSALFPGKLAATPLLLALVMIETADVVFAVDSIPAVFGITADPFIVFTSNIFAILGLRALYFCLAAMIASFRFLKPALVAILGFVGVKMMLVHTPLKIDSLVSLLVVLGLLALGVLASVMWPAKLVEETPPLPPSLEESKPEEA